MNREIKFRAWDRDSNQMVYAPVLVKFKEESFLYRDALRRDLMQFTGLKDKNGKDIYEGDIVKHQFEFNNGFGTVKYYSPAFKLDGKKGTCDDFNWDDWEEFEVIGNVFENPELLNGT